MKYLLSYFFLSLFVFFTATSSICYSYTKSIVVEEEERKDSISEDDETSLYLLGQFLLIEDRNCGTPSYIFDNKVPFHLAIKHISIAEVIEIPPEA